MEACKVRLKDLAKVMSMRSQPVCLAIGKDLRDKDERLYYNAYCDFAGRKRCSRKDFMEIVTEYGEYYVWDITLFEDDWGHPYIEVSAMKNKTE